MLRRVGSGAEDAFLALVDRYHPTLLRVAQLWVPELDAAQQVVRQSWREILLRMDRFDAGASLKSWLCGALIRLARARAGVSADETANWLNEGAELPAVEPDRFSPPGDRWEGHWSSPPTDWPHMRDATRPAPAGVNTELEAALASLPMGQRVVIVLRDVEQLTSREVETLLSLSEPDQRTLLHRARSRVRERLERYHGEGR